MPLVPTTAAGSRGHPVGTLPHPAALAGGPISWSELQRILVVRPDNLGDVLLLGPALRALRAAAPQARLVLLGSPAGAAVAPLLPELDEVLVASPVWQDAGPAGSPDPASCLDLAERVRAGRFDAALIFTSFSQSPHPAGYLCLLAGVPVRAALSAEFGGGVLSHWVPARDTPSHQADRAVYLLDRLGIPVAGIGSALHAKLPPGSVAAAREAVGLAPDERYVALLPGASCSSRRWAPTRFGEVAGTLARLGHTVVVAGSEREADLVGTVAMAAASLGRVIPAAGSLEVPELAGLLAGAEAAVVNNSGGMHLADAVRTPVVVLFAGTELVEEYQPRSTRAYLARRPTTCTPCRAFRCPYAHECLEVPAAEVVETVLRLAAPP